MPDIEDWIEFETLRGEERNPILKTRLIGRGDQSRVSLGTDRVIDVLNAPIRLISTRWIYDEASKTLFSSDMFSHIWSNREDGPWMLGGNEEDESTLERLASEGPITVQPKAKPPPPQPN